MEPGLNGGFTVEPPSCQPCRYNPPADRREAPWPSYLGMESQLGGPTWVDSPICGTNLHSEDPGRNSRMNEEELR
jgi:hypothetical protein